MANGFQANAPQVGASSSGLGAPAVDTTTAQAIEGLSNLGGRVRKQSLEEGLKRSFSTFAEDAAQIGQTSSEDINIRDLNDQQRSQLSDAERRIRRLKVARKNGRLTESALQIEAEKILQDKILEAPAFEDDFRRLAASTLGFDPTGATVQTLMASATAEPEGPQIPEFLKGTDFGRQIITVMQQKQLGMIDNQRANQAIAEVSELANITRTNELLDSRLKMNNLSTERWLGKVLNTSVPQVARDAFRTMFYEEGPNGELVARDSVDATSVKQTLEARKRQVRSSITSRLTDSGVAITPEIEDRIDKSLESRFQTLESLADNRDLMERMNRQASVLQDSFEIEAAKAAPVLMFADSLGISSEYMELLKTPERYRKIAEQINPGLEDAADIADMSVEIHNNVARHLSGDFDWTIKENRQAHSDAAASMASRGDKESQEGALEVLKKTGKPGYNTSNFARSEFARSNVNPELQGEYANFLNLQTEQIVQGNTAKKAQEAIKQIDQDPMSNTSIEIVNGQLTVSVTRGRETTPAPAPVANIVNKLNAINAAAQNGWGPSIKSWSPTFLEDWRNKLRGEEKNGE